MSTFHKATKQLGAHSKITQLVSGKLDSFKRTILFHEKQNELDSESTIPLCFLSALHTSHGANCVKHKIIGCGVLCALVFMHVFHAGQERPPYRYNLLTTPSCVLLVMTSSMVATSTSCT